jgi:glucans biosynthesis protein C
MRGESSRQAATYRLLIAASLLCATWVPIVYFGAQFLGAGFYPNFSVWRDVASALGSDVSARPEIFNVGISIAGFLAIAGTFGIFKSLQQLRVNVAFSLIVALTLLSFGAGSFWAASHPLPDPRHDPGFLSAGLFAAPIAAYLSVRRLAEARWIRAICGVLLFVFLVVVGFYSGFLPLDRGEYEGALQRAGAFAMLVPISVLAWWLLGHSPGPAPE